MRATALREPRFGALLNQQHRRPRPVAVAARCKGEAFAETRSNSASRRRPACVYRRVVVGNCAHAAARQVHARRYGMPRQQQR